MKLFDRWSEEEIQILHDNYQNKTYAASLNRKAEVYDFLRRINPCIERKAV
jgi:hypothetical protein